MSLLSTKVCSLPPGTSGVVVNWVGMGFSVNALTLGASGCLKSGPTAQAAKNPNRNAAVSRRAKRQTSSWGVIEGWLNKIFTKLI